VFWESIMILVKWVELWFLLIDSCLFKCIEVTVTHKHFLEHVLGTGVIKNWDFRWKWVEPETVFSWSSLLKSAPEVRFWSQLLKFASEVCSWSALLKFASEVCFWSCFWSSASEQHPLFCVLVPFSHISVLNWLLVQTWKL